MTEQTATQDDQQSRLDEAAEASDHANEATDDAHQAADEAAEVADGADAAADSSDEARDGADDDADDDSGDDSGDDSDDDSDDDGDEADGDPLETEGEIAADYLEELLDIADFDGDIDTFVEGNRPHVSIITEGDVLVGRDGEVLEALQELSRLAVMTETGNRSRLMLDIGGYREDRRKQLTALATDAVEDVRSSGESVRLAAMNPFERKIVHDVVAGAGLTSESEGEEPDRRVVILPKA